MNLAALKTRLTATPAPLLLHVLPAEIFQAVRISGSSNACIYETAFLSTVAAMAPDKNREIIVYGAGEGSLDAITALEKLSAAGYLRVFAFEEGIDGWRAAGLPLESDIAMPSAEAPDGIYHLDTAESVVRWTGRNLFNHHSGTVRLASGQIELRNRTLESARFLIDMKSIACEDLLDPAWNEMLIRHLQDADFFDVGNHPTAEFVTCSASPIPGATAGTPNFVIRGNFTLRGVTRPLDAFLRHCDVW